MGTGVKFLILYSSIVGYNPDTSEFPKWESVRPTIFSECTEFKDDQLALRYINNLVNKTIIYKREDEDLWQTPIDTISKQLGDCEDYAILKMDLLARIFNICNTDLAVVQNRKSKEYHAVVKVYGKKISILDNRFDNPISEAKYNKVYKEIYVIGRLGWKKN